MNELRLIGLSQNEQRVYLALFNTGIVSVRELTEILNIKRTSLYLYLSELKEKGFVSEITDKKKKYFQAVNPSGLKKVVKTKIEELEKIEKSIPSLISQFKSSKSKKGRTNTKTYKGIISIPDLVQDVANSKTDIYFLGSIKSLQHYLGFDFLEKIYTRTRRRNLKITDYLISDWAASTIRRYHEEEERFSKIRFLPPSLNPKGCFVSFNNKLIVGQFFPEPNATVFEDLTMVELFKIAFLSLWEKLEGKHIPPQQKDY